MDSGILSVYPNPLNANGNIEWRSNRSISGALSLYDVLGRQCATLFMGNLSAGSTHFSLPTGNLSSGNYWLVFSHEQSLQHIAVRVVR
jgi:hypothetical protein